MLPMLIPLIAYLFGDDAVVDRTGKSLLEFIVECADSVFNIVTELYTPFFRLLFDFFEWAYSITIGAFIDLVCNIIDTSKDNFVINGKLVVDRLFDKLSFASVDFTENFIFWFIGLLFFSFTAKYIFSFMFGLFKKAIDLLLGI